jgi:hypothetical protein
MLGGTKGLKVGAYEQRGMSGSVEGKIALYKIILPKAYGANDAVILRPL